NPVFHAGEPWLLRFFDQVRFHPVGEAELERLRDDFREGRASVRIEETMFDYAAYRRFLEDEAHSIEAFRERQAQAFQAEVARWRDEDVAVAVAAEPVAAEERSITLAHGQTLVEADLCGNVWKIPVGAGQAVSAGDTLVIVEAMKMEIRIVAPAAGVVVDVVCREGRPV